MYEWHNTGRRENLKNMKPWIFKRSNEASLHWWKGTELTSLPQLCWEEGWHKDHYWLWKSYAFGYDVWSLSLLKRLFFHLLYSWCPSAFSPFQLPLPPIVWMAHELWVCQVTNALELTAVGHWVGWRYHNFPNSPSEALIKLWDIYIKNSHLFMFTE